MRRLLRLLVMLLYARSASAAEGTIKPGDIWPDDRGQHVQAHGGGIIKLADTYYWFGEYRCPNLDRNKRYVGCYSSNDLTHWTFRNQVLKQTAPEEAGGSGRFVL